jgi:hypothetical protein
MHRLAILAIAILLLSSLLACADEPVVITEAVAPEPEAATMTNTTPALPQEPSIITNNTNTELPPDDPLPPIAEPETPPLAVTEPELEPELPLAPLDFKVVGYITHWHLNRIDSIDLEGLSYLIWQGIEVNNSQDPTLRVANDAGWWQVSKVAEAGHAVEAKVLASLIGHWNETALTEVWQSTALRAELIDNLVDLVEKYNLDGIDLDNESSSDPATYSTFIAELRQALPAEKTISMAGSPYRVSINPEVSEALDFINLMTYDMGKGQGYPYHSTLEESIVAMDLWANAGIPKAKILMGIPFYGRDGHVTGFEYWWIVDKYNPPPEQNQATEPLAAGGTIWWNGPDLVAQKVSYAKDNGFGGVMVYELGTDSTDNKSLLKAVFTALALITEPMNIILQKSN